MNSPEYFPSIEGDMLVWLLNFQHKLPMFADTLSINKDQLVSAINDAKAVGYIINQHDALKKSLQQFTAYKRLLYLNPEHKVLGSYPELVILPDKPIMVEGGALGRIFDLVRSIKKNVKYTDAIGKDLGVIAPENIKSSRIDGAPLLKSKLDLGRPHLKWVKGNASAIDLYADHNDGKGFTYLGRFLRNEFIDLTPLPENKTVDEWKYKAIYVLNDEQVGNMSQEIAIKIVKS